MVLTPSVASWTRSAPDAAHSIVRALREPTPLFVARVSADPHSPSNSRWLAFDLDLPAHGGGELLLVTPAPHGTNSEFAAQPWWSNVELR